jgi:hypothetical protein
MSKAQFIKPKFSKVTKEPRAFLTEQEQKGCASMAQAIKLCKKKHPDAKNGEIARYLGIRPQWVHNVLNYVPKRQEK